MTWDPHREDEARWVEAMRQRHARGQEYVCGLADALRTMEERDEARAEVERLRSERDEAREHASTAAFMRVERQRDEARAEVEVLKARIQKLERPGDYLGALKELERHQRHHHAYNEVFVRELAKGKSREEAHEIAGKACYSKEKP